MFNTFFKINSFIGLLLTVNFGMGQDSKINKIQYQSYDKYPVYLKSDLGVTYTATKTTVKLWSPNVEETKINLYKQGNGGEAITAKNLDYDKKTGVWQIVLEGNYHNTYYTLQVKNKEIGLQQCQILTQKEWALMEIAV